MVLSDRSIRDELAQGRLVIDPLGDGCIQPSSVDLRLAPVFRVFRVGVLPRPYLDVTQPMEGFTELVEVTENEPFIIQPGEFVLAATLETITLPDDIVARVDGKSSLGRLGLLIHATAGFVDPGWTGRLTLELSNVAKMPIAVRPGMRICQISFLRLTTPAERLYGSPELGSKYQGQTGPTASRAHQDFPKNTD
ncbi:MAG: dCTP deaminase [Dehalococcoidia bacterium]